MRKDRKREQGQRTELPVLGPGSQERGEVREGATRAEKLWD